MQEFLSGGLVTTRDPSLLAPGELSVAEDVQLRPGDPSLYKAPGRSRFNNTALTNAIDALAYCVFDGATDRLVAVSGGSYKIAAAGNTGDFSTLASGAGTRLATASLNNRSALLSGGTNKVLLSNGTVRSMGLDPVTTAPGATRAAGSGTLFATLGTGWFDYWTTEVYISGSEEVEGTFTGIPKTINVIAATDTVTITKPPQVNTAATHWRIYRSNKKTNETDTTGFPIGFRIGTVEIGTSSVIDGGGTAGSLTLPTTAEDVSVADLLQPGVTDAGGWVNKGNITADDGIVATSATVTYNSRSGVRAGAFGFSNISNQITDITVEVKAQSSAGQAGSSDIQLAAWLSWDGGVSWTVGQSFNIPYPGFGVRQVSGLWGRTWKSSETSNANLYVRIVAYGAFNGSSGTVDVDYIKVRITHGGTSAAQAIQFPAIIITAGPSQGPFGSNGKPPSATTGDVFQGSLVTNDVANPRQIAWTIPGTLDYSPPIYRMAFDFTVQRIATLGNVLVIGQVNQIEGLRFLPLEDDSEFNTGRALVPISTDEGVVSPAAACKFTMQGDNGGREMLFYVGYSQLMMTDGFGAEPATLDIVWPKLVNQGALSKVHVVKNARYREIKIHYPAVGSVTTNKTLVLSYDPYHLKNGKLKVVGITNYAATASAAGVLDDTNEPAVFTGGADGFVYKENNEYKSAAGNTIIPRISTREMYLEDFSGSWALQSLGVHHQANGAALLDVSYTATQANTPSRTGALHTFSPSERRLSIIDGGEAGEGIIINLTSRDDGNPLTLDYLLVNKEPIGETTTLKS